MSMVRNTTRRFACLAVCFFTFAETSECFAQAKGRSRSAGIHWTLRDIDVQTLHARLKRFGVELPVPASGRVTVRLSLNAPWRSILRPGAYEVDGDLSSAALTVAGIALEKLTVHLAYHEGELELTKMSFVLPGKAGTDGSITGQARMKVSPPGDLNAELTLDGLPLATLAGAAPGLADQVSGTVSGQFSGSAPAERLRDLTAWQAQGKLTAADLKAFGLPAVQATTNLQLSRGQASLTSLTAQFEGARITAGGQLALAAPYEFNSRLRVAMPSLDWLNKLEADFRPPMSVAGNFALSADASGQLTPRRVRVRGTFEGRELKAEDVVIDRLVVPYDGTLDRIRVNNLRIELYGGRITANLSLPTKGDGKVGAGVRVDNVDLAHAASDALKQKQSWRGSASGLLQFRVPATKLFDTTAWSGQGQLTFGRGNLFGIDVARIAANVGVADGRLTVSNLALDSAIAQVTGSLNANLTTPFGFGTALRLENVDFAQLNRLPEELRPPVTVAGRAGVSLRAQGTLQPLSVTARGGVATRRLSAAGLAIDSLNFNYRLSEKQISLSQMAGALYGGSFGGSATLPLGDAGHSQADLSWRQVDIGRMLGAIDAAALQGIRSRGTTSGRITAQADGNPRQPANWQATAAVNLAGLQIDRATLGRATIEASLAKQVLTVSRIASEGGSMRVSGSATVGLASPHEFGLKVNVANADLSIANGLPAKLRLPATVGGTVNLSADLKGRLDPVRIEGDGKFSARNVTVDRARIDSLSFTFSDDNDLLAVSDLAVVAYRGRLDGSVKLPLAQDAAGAIDVRWRQINLGRMLTDLRSVALQSTSQNQTLPKPLLEALAETPLEGWTWGAISVQTPAGKLLDPAAWTGNVDVSLAALRLFGWTGKQAFIRGKIAHGRAELNRLAFDFDGTRIRGEAGLALAKPYDFESKFSLDNLQLADFNELPKAIQLPVKVSGAVSVSMEAQGTLQPLEVTGNGSVTGDQLRADGAQVDRLAIRLSAEKNRLKLSSFEADLYGGQIHGEAAIALKGDEAGQVDFNWQDINLGKFATDVAKLPAAVTGTVAGKIHVGIPANKLADFLAWTVDASFDTSPLVTRSQRLGELHGRLIFERGLLDYRLDGELLRGSVELVGRWQTNPHPGAAALNEGSFDLNGAQLDALTPLVGGRGNLSSLTGGVRAHVKYRHAEKTGLPEGSGNLALDDVRLNGGDLLDALRGTVRVSGDRIEIVSANAALAGGSLTLSGVVFFNPNCRGSLRITVSGADARQLLAPMPQLASKLRGVVDAQLDSFFGGGRPLVVTGTIGMPRGRAAGLEFNAVRVPVNGSIDLVSRRGAFQLHGLTGQVAHGRITGDFDATLGNGFGLNGHGKLAGIDLRTLMSQSGSVSRLASGKVTGSYTLAGRNIRTVNDLTGKLDATLQDTQAMSLPIFQQVLPYLTGGVSGSTTFDDGTVRASLSRGVVRVERVSLSSGSVQLYGQGNVTLAGRLNLNVTVKTGELNGTRRAIALLASRVLLVAAPPVGLLVNITQFLSNQVVNLEVTGTVRSPTIRIRPLQLLGQEAAQFFLIQAVP
ncbi:MAG TPA: AsmA-like C-terminal region-containing protein [Pirellulales bacterium]|nr:AsmA-like C-terminal region-containing protein [Pirellulales bacterium]